MNKVAKILGVVLVAGVSLSSPITQQNTTTLVEKYTVQPEDTLYTICEQYRKLDCTDPYILEYMDTIRHWNPELVENKNQLQPGDKLNMVYKVKEYAE